MKDETEVGKSYHVLSLDYRAGATTEFYRDLAFELTFKEVWGIAWYKEKEKTFLGKRKNMGKSIRDVLGSHK